MIRALLTRRRKGAMAMVALAALVPVTAMLAASMNTSQMVDDRRQVQDASDALATLHGTWSARALNIISMNNVTAAQLLTVAVGSEALYATNIQIGVSAGLVALAIGEHAALECAPILPPILYPLEDWWVTKACPAWMVAIGAPALLGAARALDHNSDFNPGHGMLTARKAVLAIDGMNKALAARHPRAMREIAEGYYSDLEITDHHFADPCLGALVENCRRANSADGMALPIEASNFEAWGKMMSVMMTGSVGTDTTFIERGFDQFNGPMQVGGTDDFPAVVDHINDITEIGNTLYEFDFFYRSKFSEMPTHPYRLQFAFDFPFGPFRYDDPSYTGQPFEDRSYNGFDIAVTVAEVADLVAKIGLTVVRNVYPFRLEQHDPYFLDGEQSRRDSNAFYTTYWLAYGSLATGPGRDSIPIGYSLRAGELLYPTAIPETFQLLELGPITEGIVPPVEPLKMPEPFHLLSYAYKDAARRLSEAVIPTLIEGHTGYGQAGIFSPDGATLYTQNWQTQLMPATRMDDVRGAARDLGLQARDAFDPLAEQLGQVGTTSSWSRVHAH